MFYIILSPCSNLQNIVAIVVINTTDHVNTQHKRLA
jgi:hypothetical protein